MSHLIVTQHPISNNVITHIEKNRNLLTNDVSNYAKGRSRAWIGCEAPLSDGFDFQQAPFDFNSELWKWTSWFCRTKLHFTPECALLHVGGASCGDPTDKPLNGPGGECGIQQHRDAGYADYLAVGINLMGEATFGYQEEYPYIDRYTKDKNTNSQIEYVKMVSGTSIMFNCKNPHFAEVGPNRWCINAWRISNKRRENYLKFIESSK